MADEKFIQSGTKSGRFNSSAPNYSNLPREREIRDTLLTEKPRPVIKDDQMPDHNPFDEVDSMNEPDAIKRTAFGLVSATVFSKPQTPQEVDDCAEHVEYAIRLALKRGQFGDEEAELVRGRWAAMVEAWDAAREGPEA